jgi:LuxR family transcriptional regulator, maltose regulon positive regulatory protein
MSPAPSPCRGIPPLPHALIKRSRLSARLGDRERRPITLVSGLPGAGKTTLVASWLRSTDRPAVWVSLDSRHDAPGALARATLRGLAAIGATPEPPARRRRSDSAMIETAFDSLGEGRWVLVLDDVHELRSSAALAALRMLLDGAPPGLAVVLCTRADPPVALGRMRLDGRLGEIRNADLEFTPDEAADLLAAHGIDVGHDDIHALCLRTQGWAAGLRLAAGALATAGDRHELIRSTATTEAVVADYLLEEVLDRQDPGAQSFLLRTSVAERLTPELAGVLSGDDHAQERLDELERSGVFLIDSADGWYRYHALFADLLRASLRRRHPELVPELHGRAAAWLLDRHRPADAELHARLAGDWTLAGRLAGDRWVTAVLDDAEPATDLASGTPPDAVGSTAGLSLVAAGLACARGDKDGADLHRARLDDLVATKARRRRDEPAVDPSLRLILDLAYGCVFGADRRARQAATALAGSTDRELDVDASALRRWARLRAAELDVDEGRFDRAVTSLCAIADTGDDDDWMRTEASAVLAVVDAANGNLAAAHRRATEVLAEGDTHGVRPAALVAACLASALCCAQRGERRSALGYLDRADASGAAVPRPLHAALRAVRAGLGGSTRSTAWLDSLTAEHPLATQALVAAGVLEIVDPDRRLVTIGGRQERAVARARQELARGAPDAARAALGAVASNGSGADPAGSPDHPPAHPRTAIETCALAAVAASRSGRDDEAREHLAAALELVTWSGVRAPLLDHAAGLAVLLDGPGLDAEHQGLALELVDQLRRTPTGRGTPVEVLTERETAVLMYLPTLMSNAEIAQGLHLSINTVKSHLKAVYRKLGVVGRRDAVLRGRELELI